MTSNRVFRKGYTHEEAIQRIEAESGKQFNPRVVEAFKAIISEALREIKEYEATHTVQS